MFGKKILLLAAVFILDSGFTPQSHQEIPSSKTMLVNKSGSLIVRGSTNVNTFDCIVINYCKPDTIVFHPSHSKTQTIDLSGDILIDIQSFDCHNSMMTAELRKILKAKEYPHLKIHFVSLAKCPTFNNQKEHIKGVVFIELAKVKKRFDIDFDFYKDENQNMHMLGSRDVNFSDFNITPPTKLGGMIKTRDKLGIEFHLQLKEI
ncbi:MAG: YceI family protein [Bacteroidetes bacterium]|nr:YceI family protein [Bacteroidota bacterium]MBU1371308.1 YceI family protein [Bacteroidota bacterium]MBU1485795.1 YceI family protein [Bacteroidota bacterium]MBU1761585.1 YceI family protein [Bacteroidota bacterium]MBU2267590.1 YceI family protein [Bacteroidota bacterium]